MIVSRAEVLAYLGRTTSITDSQLGLLALIHEPAEKAVSELFGIPTFAQTTITEFLPSRAGSGAARSPEYWDVQGTRAVRKFPRNRNRSLYLYPPVRSVTNIWEDRAAHGGLSGDFASGTELTEGVDFSVDWRESGISTSGQILRLSGGWSQRKGTIKATYSYGFSATEFRGGGIGSHIHLAILKVVASEFNNALQAAGGGAGTIKSEKLGDYAVTYESGSTGVVVPADVRKELLGGQRTSWRRFI